MKPVIAYLLSASLSLLCLGGNAQPADCGAVPQLNTDIVNYVNTKIGKCVARGECWDLAAEALNASGAVWDKRYGFGKETDPARDCIFPGDIVQFEGVKIKYRKGNYFYEELMAKHTAVVYGVNNDGTFIVAEQNTSQGGRKVALNALDLKNIVKGRVRFYRPVGN